MRRSARISGAVAAAAALAFLVGGCGGDGGGTSIADPGDKHPDLSEEPGGSGPPGEAADGSEGNGEGGGDGSVDPSAMVGAWATHPAADGESVVFSISPDKRVFMILPDRCDGKANGTALDLTCEGGGTDYTSGTVTSVSGKSMTVKWKSGRTVELGKSSDPELASPPPDLPTDFPSADDPF
ncbi:hypothetical protein ABZ820_05765 [Streptomyces diacarni]|uniref:hypothetical protein n=1 Tax=Streptomyces diacarni TaxID=2800381 RepID=UPI003407C77C